jgi:hypothetical protein
VLLNVQRLIAALTGATSTDVEHDMIDHLGSLDDLVGLGNTFESMPRLAKGRWC